MPGVKANTQKKGGDKEKVGGGGKEGMQARLGISGDKKTCQMCKMDFMPRTARLMLEQHVESKHAKNGFDACFPGFVDPK